MGLAEIFGPIFFAGALPFNVRSQYQHDLEQGMFYYTPNSCMIFIIRNDPACYFLKLNP